jgi:hypothetical protein
MGHGSSNGIMTQLGKRVDCVCVTPSKSAAADAFGMLNK